MKVIFRTPWSISEEFLVMSFDTSRQCSSLFCGNKSIFGFGGLDLIKTYDKDLEEWPRACIQHIMKLFRDEPDNPLGNLVDIRKIIENLEDKSILLEGD